MALLQARIDATVVHAAQFNDLAAPARALAAAWQRIALATEEAWASGDPAEALANAVPYLQAFGHAVLAWIWLDVAIAALRRELSAPEPMALAGTIGCMNYFYQYELGKIDAWLAPVGRRDMTCARMPLEAF